MTEYAHSTFDVEAYLSKRPRYPDRVYELLAEYRHDHEIVEGGTLLDLGCGPGMASWPLLDQFDHVIGIDPGASMIDTARQAFESLSAATYSKRLARARFEVAGVEQLQSLGLKRGSVDCVIAATAAHWFDMRATYAQLAPLMTSGATLALWTYDLAYPSEHASTVPMVSKFAYEDLKGFVDIGGSRRIRSLYAELDLPEDDEWTDLRYICYPNTGKANGYLPILSSDRKANPLLRSLHNGRLPIIWDERLHTSGIVSWDDLKAAKRTNSSYFNWRKQNPDVPVEQDIAARQVDALRGQIMTDRQHGIGVSKTLQDDQVEIMRPMGLLLMRKR